MAYNIKEWTKIYGPKTIETIVEQVKALDKQIVEKGKELIELLWGLERTKRWKEYPGYKDLEFKVFLDEICWIKYNRYNELRYAYQWFPEEVQRYGPHIIQAIKQRVGVVNLPRVLKKLNTMFPQVETGKQREKLNMYIDTIAPKKKSRTGGDTKAYWRQQAQEYKARLEDALVELRKKNQRIAELQAQVNRQKEPIKRYAAIRELINQRRSDSVSAAG